MMRVVMDGAHPRRFWVTSESESEVSYLVDLCAQQIGVDSEGVPIYNGWCGGPNGIHGCRDFIFRCEKHLKNPENTGKVFRCKHIRAARDKALDALLPHIKRTDPNMEEEHQV